VQEGNWPTIAVLGAGAVGCYFGGMLARAGAPVTLIGRQQHVEAIMRGGLFLDSLHGQQHVPVATSTEVEAVRGAELVLFCVKTPDTEAAARSLVPHLASGAVVVCLQNGVDNVERIRAVAGIDAVPAVVYVAAQMTAPGCVKHTGRGDLIVGDLGKGDPGDEARRRLEYVASVFGRAGVPCRISENVEAELWVKLLMNCAFNAISAVTRARYGCIANNPWMRDIMRQIVDETVAVARAAGVEMPDVNLLDAVWKLAEAMPQATSSTAQDIGRGKHTEIDSLNGYVARRGVELGIATPVNQTLHALVKLLEEQVVGTVG
jgi:2-dehydropantoate 2-reductase